MKINNIEITSKHFAYDGCHKIYLIESKDDEKEALEIGYDILPIEVLKETYKCSCGLKFISNWQLDTSIVEQCGKAKFTR